MVKGPDAQFAPWDSSEAASYLLPETLTFLEEDAYWQATGIILLTVSAFPALVLTFGLLLIGDQSPGISRALLSQALPNNLPTLMRLRWPKGKSKES